MLGLVCEGLPALLCRSAGRGGRVRSWVDPVLILSKFLSTGSLAFFESLLKLEVQSITFYWYDYYRFTLSKYSDINWV